MGSGEADLARRTLAASSSLDAYTRCRVEGCGYMVHLSGAEPRCHRHGGRDGIPEYLTDSDSGAFIDVRHMTSFGSDCE